MTDKSPAVETRDASTRDCFVACLAAPLLLAVPVLLTYTVFSGKPPDAARGAAPYQPIWSAAHWFVIALLTAGLAYPLVNGTARRYWVYYQRIRLSTIAQNMLVVIIVVAFAVLLRSAMPFLDRSWLYKLPLAGGEALNLSVLPILIRYIGPVYAVLLLMNLPDWAHHEEMKFRQGTRDWRHAVGRSIGFGLWHCLFGVPIYAGLALSIGGLWFSYHYFRGGVERSTMHHLTYNLVIVSLLLACVLHHSGR